MEGQRTMDNDTPIGKRIRYYRRRIGMSQAALAEQVGRSESWLQKVEAGDLLMDSMSVLLALARVLKVGPWDLQPKLGLPPNGGAPNEPPKGFDAIHRAMFTPDVDVPVDEASLRAEVLRARQMDSEGSYEALAMVLPSVLLAGRAATAEDEPVYWGHLAGAYQVAASFTRGFGELDLALLTGDRAVGAAIRSGDEALVGLSQQRLSSAMLTKGWLDAAGGVASDAADALAPTSNSSSQVWSVWGMLQIIEALAAVRGNDAASAWRLMRDTRAVAEHLGSGHNDYLESFGPANVGTIEVAVALESGDPVEAVRIAERLDVEELPMRERRAQVLLTLAKAHAIRARHADAVLALLAAEDYAPQVVRYSGQAHEIVRMIVKRKKVKAIPQLRGLVDRLGVTTWPT